MPRSPRRRERLEFTAPETEPIVARMAVLAKAGEGWVNLLPRVDEDDERPTALRFFTLFGGGGTGIAMATWVPSDAPRGGHEPTTVGITHLRGTRVATELPGLGVPIPVGWTITQDHPRRGLVLRVAAADDPRDTLAWTLRALGVLGPARPTSAWRADIYLPTGL